MVNLYRNVIVFVEYFWVLWIFIWKLKIFLMWKLNCIIVGLGKFVD